MHKTYCDNFNNHKIFEHQYLHAEAYSRLHEEKQCVGVKAGLPTCTFEILKAQYGDRARVLKELRGVTTPHLQTFFFKAK
jgi:hypothetical protein